jgi:hypothetical protein
MGTVLEERIIQEHRSVVRFLWAKGLNAMDIHKDIFPAYCGKCLSHKAVQTFVANISLMTKRLKRKWLRQQSKTYFLRVSTHW